MNKILVLCTANICRSPVAEALLKSKLSSKPDIQIYSAGTHAQKGTTADALSIEVANTHGYDIASHQSTPLSPILMRKADIVLVMDQHHLEFLANEYPNQYPKCYMIGKWDHMTVLDPYRKGYEHFEKMFGVLEKCTDSWANKIKALQRV